MISAAFMTSLRPSRVLTVASSRLSTRLNDQAVPLVVYDSGDLSTQQTPGRARCRPAVVRVVTPLCDRDFRPSSDRCLDVTGAWQRLAFANPDLPVRSVDLCAYALRVLEVLLRGLRCHDVLLSATLGEDDRVVVGRHDEDGFLRSCAAPWWRGTRFGQVTGGATARV